MKADERLTIHDRTRDHYIEMYAGGQKLYIRCNDGFTADTVKRVRDELDEWLKLQEESPT